MRQGDLYRDVETGWTVLVVSNTSFNTMDHPFITGICLDLEATPEYGFPFEVPVFIADDRMLVHLMAMAPWRKERLEPIGRSLNPEDMLAVLNAMFRVLGVTPTGQHESCPDHHM